ncbi:carbohydrate ABC transporter permease [Anaerocolumna xylanovorans]|uniref:Carbohydrate ABC transporter membrane protein 2, CUT1 family (TC 3.A.1.1.-) n=1 Tax=Anaerocolumna xylanovorans DSM 12503 TaxID=1121345 RepID=A0A1M7XXU5_9FIRM|nr:carbohydrate ABC transporter permease [Anaerocolumna xylanovorans]SHO43799.1 carbohydrate ABC transporter membrane protein 2, CUT1 family (TC 3.A.1.1.-) [Anaerocolumna xylanovorans DSM 12503]
MNKKKAFVTQDNIVKVTGNLLLIIFLLLIIIPVIYILLCSIMDPATRSSVGVSFDIKHWTLEGYRRVFEDANTWRGFRNSFVYSVSFTVISVGVTLLAAYPMSRNDFMGRKFFNVIFVLTMFFGGGLMPTYLLMDQLNLINTVWAVLLPGALNVWNLILARSYYRSIPTELREAAEMDGTSELQYFFKVLIPVCTPIIAVLCLYQFVAQWNSYFDAMIYLDDQKLQPLQLVIRAILVQNQINPNLVANMEKIAETAKLADLLKYSTIVISSIPLLLMYPFFSKYFEKGIMAGSVKG